MTEPKTEDRPLEKEFAGLIDALELPALQKRFMHSRWLDQLLWMEGRAAKAQRRYYILRLTAIVGGVIVPALVGLDRFQGLTVVISLIVAVSVAVEEFFHFGERWRHYRRTAEALKMEGWQFFQLSGGYQNFATHAGGYPEFAARVEDCLGREVDVFIAEIAREKKARRQDD